MSAFTPGPWAVATVGGRKHVYGKGNAHYRIAVVAHDPAGIGATESIKPEVKANASLIAAAPELLEALHHAEAFVATLAEGGRRPDTHDAMLALRMYRAAIAKADGGK